jgi:hypothetical protein
MKISIPIPSPCTVIPHDESSRYARTFNETDCGTSGRLKKTFLFLNLARFNFKSFFSSYAEEEKTFLAELSLSQGQGDQIGQIFSLWSIVYLRAQCFENYKSCPHFWAIFPW